VVAWKDFGHHRLALSEHICDRQISTSAENVGSESQKPVLLPATSLILHTPLMPSKLRAAPVPDESSTAQRGIQSIEVGGQLLRALAAQGSSMALKDLAREGRMSAARAHPYLVSFCRIGLVQRDAATGRYSLGELAHQLGLISLQQGSPVHAALPLLAPLSRQIGHTVALASWGSRGPTIIRVEEPPTVVHATLRHGSVFSLSGTASGRLFAAYLPEAQVRALLKEERESARRNMTSVPAAGMPVATPVPSWKDFAEQLKTVREHGISRSEGEIVPGISAMAAPVFDAAGQLCLALIAIGAAGIFDARWDGAVALGVRVCAELISRRLGFNEVARVGSAGARFVEESQG
jgi:DNA-binding IclR family transcriptional regulator